MDAAVKAQPTFPSKLQKEKAVNDKKEDKKTKKAKENAEAEANEENHSENGEAKTNEVRSVSTLVTSKKRIQRHSSVKSCASRPRNDQHKSN